MSTSTNAITPDLQAKLDKAREEHTNGELCALALLKMLSHGWKTYSVANRLLMDEIPVSFKTCCIIMTNKEF